ncbi:MAG: TonB-dependent receptor [Bacteroidota bacterium]|nr:TonB-dependent receptor [Bacteroidota bacterium]
MKKKILILLAFFTFLVPAGAFAKDATTKTSFKVWGNCENCKKRIEKAAKTEGVKTAEWSEEKKVITVTFVPSKISVDQIQQNIAKVGYDTEKYKADEDAYNKLPKCCQYDRKK